MTFDQIAVNSSLPALKDSVAKGENIVTLQMELNYGSEPRAAERGWCCRAGGRGGVRGVEKLNACASFQHSGAWELRQLGRALRNILSCNVNMSEL